MKTTYDPRHKRRQSAVKSLFSYSFTQKQSFTPKVRDIINKLDIIDDKIRTIAPDFPVEKINRIDLAILRLSTYELLIEQKEPPKVILDEAIELAKEFGGESSPSFINGALGKLLNDK